MGESFFQVSKQLKKKNLNEEDEEKDKTEDYLKAFDDIENIKLNLLESSGIECILEDASIQLFIIDVGTCSSNSIHSKNVNISIRDIIDELKEEITQKGTFATLCKKVKEEIIKENNEKNLLKNLKKNQLKMERLKLMISECKSSKEEEYYKNKEIIANLKDKIHEEIVKANAKLRFVDKWETAKRNQNRFKCQLVENELEKKLDGILQECENEIRVHNEICNFLNLDEKKLLNEIIEWQERYKKEMESRSEKIKLLQLKRNEQQILLRNLTQLVNIRI
ncbi:conserved hypothetical protein [Pediculus humanus corporis]|uniref:Uncharacterized protein n=1 Tax=Pediculus humanus subsp. corporis TaxID=121224 RepID=E0VPM5_PEDHC|nr:uncharacterized protein Phum_PHUM361820 [Pediculus humanus corporis]EEB15331.1 conserved hypothetical protein [Pediculus humanus corporis]